MPRTVLERLDRERTLRQRQPTRPGESSRDRALREGKLFFAKADKFLDVATTGPRHLSDAVAAQIVERAILFGVPERYELFDG